MIKISNLRDRIQAGFLFFCLIQFVLVLALTIFSYHYGEDSALSRAVESGGTIEEIVGKENLPEAMYTLLADLDIGTHELSGQDNPEYSGKELHVSVFDDATGNRTWRLLRFTERVSSRSLLADYSLFVAAAFLLLFLFGGWLGRTIAQRISKPIELLVDRIGTSKIRDTQTPLSDGLPGGDVQLIAESLDEAFSRINSALIREKTFARNVSHELRTPLTVVTTALSHDHTKVLSVDSIHRARRACEEMELLTAACLDLSRDPVSATDTQTIPIAVVVKEIVKEYVYLLNGKAAELDVMIEDNAVSSPAPGSFARLVIGNVVRNAFIHCASGQISIVLSTDTLKVTNSVCDDGQSSIQAGTDLRGFGVGFSVLGQASERLGWSFDINYVKDKKIAVATVTFTNS